MIRPLLMIALAFACAAALLPIRSTPPTLLSDADGIEWNCSKSVLILTTCVSNRLDGARLMSEMGRESEISTGRKAIEKAVQRILGFMAYRRKSRLALMAA